MPASRADRRTRRSASGVGPWGAMSWAGWLSCGSNFRRIGLPAGVRAVGGAGEVRQILGSSPALALARVWLAGSAGAGVWRLGPAGLGASAGAGGTAVWGGGARSLAGVRAASWDLPAG